MRGKQFIHLPPSALRCLLLLCWMVTVGCDRHPTLPLKQIQQIRTLSETQLRQGFPVSLEGIVTYYDPRTHLLILQDGTGGIAVDQRAPLGPLSCGDRVRLQGYTAWEAFAPVLVKSKIQVLGPGILPKCVPVSVQQALSPQFQAQRIELTGRVESSHSVENRSFELQVRQGDQRFRVTGNLLLKVPIIQLPDQEIRVRGVPIVGYSPEGKPHELTVYAGSTEDVQFNSALPPPSPAPFPQKASQELTTIWAIKSLEGEAARQPRAARVRGVVTSYEDQGLTLQDETAGIFVFPVTPNLPGLSIGKRLEIQGHTAPGEFAPVLCPDSIQILGSAPLPKPIQPNPCEGFSGLEENRWAEVEGIVQQTFIEFQRFNRLRLSRGNTPLTVSFSEPLPQATLEDLVDCRIRVRGIYHAIHSADHRLVGLALRTPNPSFLEILERPERRGFSKPSQPIHSLTEYDPKGLPTHQVKVQGWVTHVSSDGSLYVADPSGGIRINPVREGAFKVGQSVESVGFLGSAHTKPSLQSAQVQPASSPPGTPPQRVPIEAALAGIFEGQVVQVDGFILERTTSFGNQILSLQAGRTRFTAILEHPQPFAQAAKLQPKALVRLTGVCDVGWDTRTTPPLPAEVRLLLRTPEDIQVLKSAPWWTLHRLLTAMSVLAVTLVLVVFRTMGLFRRVVQKTQELKSQIQKREALEAQLRQSQKLEGVGRLAGGVAHDFNNLLTIINGYCDLLLTELPKGGDLWESASHMRKAGEHAAILTRQLLAFSRKQVLKPMVLDLNRHLAEMERMLTRLIPAHIQFSIQACPEPCLIKVDSGQIDQVIMNLVINARDAMPEGGRIELSTRHLMQPNEAESHPEVLPGPYVELQVRDTGQGMPPEVLQQIFEPFFTTKGLGKGTGLGLSTVFGIVKQSGGHIWAASKPGAGSTFRMIFPSTRETPTLPAEAPKGDLLGHGERVLVVEDEIEVRTLVARSLGAKGFEVLVAESPEDALEIADTYPQTIDLLLTDVVMPGLSGRDVARLVQQRHPLIRILFMSGFAEDIITSKGVLEEGIAFIQKPFTDQELTRKVLDTLAKEC